VRKVSPLLLFAPFVPQTDEFFTTRDDFVGVHALASFEAKTVTMFADLSEEASAAFN
jgi:hypothetical protein